MLSSNAVAHPSGRLIETAHFTLRIDPRTSAIVRLRNKKSGREWAGPGNPIAFFTYQTLSPEDFQQFIAAYVALRAKWVPTDFGKPNIEKFGAIPQEWQPASAQAYVEEEDAAHRILVRMQIDGPKAVESGRAAFPSKIFFELRLPKAEPALHLTLTCLDKRATRLPEALWLTFNPIAEDADGWRLDKSGEWISPFDVVASGNRHMHALQSGFTYGAHGHVFEVETLDAPVVALGERRTPYFSNAQPDLSKGVHSNLFNNVWGTNYIIWYGDDMRARFVLHC